jgi:hypothetical protein
VDTSGYKVTNDATLIGTPKTDKFVTPQAILQSEHDTEYMQYLDYSPNGMKWLRYASPESRKTRVNVESASRRVILAAVALKEPL